MTGYLINQVEKNTKGLSLMYAILLLTMSLNIILLKEPWTLLYCLEGAFSKEVSFYKSFKPFSDDYSLDLFT